ncbi:MAG: hypothetical protein ACI841_004523 [Planctomycetota bacterium]|jgi:hypothetical protein
MPSPPKHGVWVKKPNGSMTLHEVQGGKPHWYSSDKPHAVTDPEGSFDFTMDPEATTTLLAEAYSHLGGDGQDPEVRLWKMDPESVDWEPMAEFQQEHWNQLTQAQQGSWAENAGEFWSEWAEAQTGNWADFAEMQEGEWADFNVDDWGALTEVQEGQWKEWAELQEGQWEDWAETHEEHAEEWAEQWEEQMEAHGEEWEEYIEAIEEEAEAFEEEYESHWEEAEEVHEQYEELLEALHEAIESGDGESAIISESIKEALKESSELYSFTLEFGQDDERDADLERARKVFESYQQLMKNKIQVNATSEDRAKLWHEAAASFRPERTWAKPVVNQQSWSSPTTQIQSPWSFPSKAAPSKPSPPSADGQSAPISTRSTWHAEGGIPATRTPWPTTGAAADAPSDQPQTALLLELRDLMHEMRGEMKALRGDVQSLREHVDQAPRGSEQSEK